MLPSFLLTLLAAVPALAAPVAQASNINTNNKNIVEGKYIITLKPGTSQQDANNHLSDVKAIHKRALQRRGTDAGTGVGKVYSGGTTNFKAYSGSFDKSTIAAISQKSAVASVEPVQVITLYTTVTQPASTWGLGAISHRVTGTSNYTYDDSAGKNMWAYVVDTGVYTQHTEFENRAFWGYNAVPNTQNVDTNGHGSHCAGTIAGKTYGVAKKANIMGVKVLDGSSSTTDIVLDGFNWAVNNITKTPGRAANSVISLSLGGGKSTAFNSAVDAASQAGILIVAAAGNSNVDASTSSPGSASTAICVGAVDSTWTKASFSNFGSTLAIWAPGVAITSVGITSTSATATMSGTSMACPHVAGLSLYLKAKEGNLATVSSISARIKALATANKIISGGTGSPNLMAFNGISA